MIREEFAAGSNWIRETDPRIRLFFTILYSFAVALSSRFTSLSAALLISLILVLSAGIKMEILKKRLLAFNGLALFFWLTLPFTFTGEALAQWGWLSFSKPGVVLAAQITLKSNAVMLAFIAMISTSPAFVMAQSMEKLYVPQKIVHILLLTYRYIFVIEQEYQRLLRAIKIRGFVPRTNLHTYRTYAYLIGMILVRSADRAQRIHHAMICRGFNGAFPSLYRFRFTQMDTWRSALLMVIIIGIEVLEWMPVM